MEGQPHFLVSARKYRPVNFETVIGQESVTTTLKNAIKREQIAHAYLFCGPRGVGKTSCARIFAKNINCETHVEGEACGKCTSCKIFQQGESLAVFELDAASNNSVEDIRELVNQVRIPPQTGKYKVYIIDEVHMLSQAAFNAFLKTLEEPPGYAIFILATTEKHKILPTILSRCQIFDFKRVEVPEVTHHLENICKKEEIEYEKEALFLIAQKCEGCIRDALSLLDKIISFSSGKITLKQTQEHLNVLDDDILLQLIEYMLAQNMTDSLLKFDEIYRKGFEGDIVIEGLINCFRNLLICKEEKLTSLLEVNELYKAKYKEIADKCGVDFIVSSINILNENILQYKNANNKQLHIELLLIKLNYLKQAIQLVGEEEPFKKKTIIQYNTWQVERVIPYFREKNTPKKPIKELVVETAHLPSISAPQPTPQKVLPTTRASNIKFNSLKDLQQRYRKDNTSKKQIVEITTELLEQSKQEFLSILEHKKDPALLAFQQMKIVHQENNQIELFTDMTFNKHFLYDVKDDFHTLLENKFKQSIILSIQVDESLKTDKSNYKEVKNQTQIFEELAQKYPLLKVMKEKLDLYID